MSEQHEPEKAPENLEPSQQPTPTPEPGAEETHAPEQDHPHADESLRYDTTGTEDAINTESDEPQAAYLVTIRYGMMGIIAEMLCDLPDLHIGEMVIIKSERGIDHGDVTKRPTPIRGNPQGLGRVIRRATESDHNILGHIRANKEPEEMRYCHDRIVERKMDMKLAGIEHLFGSDKIIYYFLADGRVDFRELVKDLARRYRTRIEMRQIGVRDEARMLSDYEHCGRELCCRTFMRELEPVTMRMAKIQKSTLDPSKISGHCGRLMCCLRFEDEVYKDHKKTLPHKGDIIRTSSGQARVINSEILSQLVDVELTDGSRFKIHVNDILTGDKPACCATDAGGEESGETDGHNCQQCHRSADAPCSRHTNAQSGTTAQSPQGSRPPRPADAQRPNTRNRPPRSGEARQGDSRSQNNQGNQPRRDNRPPRNPNSGSGGQQPGGGSSGNSSNPGSAGGEGSTPAGGEKKAEE